MKVLLDTNVILDYILKREPFFEHAKAILENSFSGTINSYVSASAITDIYYLIRQAKDKETALTFIEELIQFIKIAGVNHSVILEALKSEISDFEDAVQNSAALHENITHIITRNLKDYKNSNLEIFSPEQFNELLNK